MDWANEDYVRVYTRDTADLMAIGPEGRAVWWEMLRKADKSGLIDHGGDMDTMPELLRVPHEWWEKAIPKILKRKMARDTGTALVIPNHEAASTTPKSDKQRQKEARQRRRASAIEEVTKRDGVESQNVTPESRTVTERHEMSLNATLRNALQRDATPDHTLAQPGAERLSKFPMEHFEGVYKLYPRKQGKAKGLKAAQSKVRTVADFQALTSAVATMRDAWAGHDTKFCPHWSTFIGQERWRDDELPLPGSTSTIPAASRSSSNQRGFSAEELWRMSEENSDDEERGAEVPSHPEG